MLSQEKVDHYKSKLLEARKGLMAEINEKESPEDFGSDIDGLDEEADEATDFANQRAMSQTLKDRVNEIDSALNRIENGSYGLCTKCNQPVSEKLLDFIPETSLCENCKKEAQ